MRTRRTIAAALLGATALTAGSVALAASGDDDYSASLAGKIDSSRPKNVILFVGDGMGDSEVTLARYYGKGAAGRLNMDRLPFRGSSIHYVLSPGPGPSYAPNYVGDSAPTATAWSTGKRTQDNRLSQSPSSAPNVPGSNAGYTTYLELAKAAGKATGNVSTAEITDATPAGPSSHISQRSCKGPADTRTTCPSETKFNGGLGSIAEQQVDEGFDVYLGGARDDYQETIDQPTGTTGVTGPVGSSTTVLQYAASKGYTYVGDKSALAGVSDLSGGKKVLGLFNPGNMITEYQPVFARTDAYITANPTPAGQQAVQGGSATTRCLPQDRANEPSLNDMTKKAIDLLDDDPQGFTLQVEGASIDKRDHAADPCGQIGETLAMDEAIGTALDFQKDHPDTLVIMTADHAHTSQAINSAAKPATGAAYATLQTVDGAPLRIAYGTADTGTAATTGGSQAHTGAEVPVWAIGPQAANIQGTIDETDIFRVLNGLTPSKVGKDGAPGTPGAAGAPGASGAPGQNGAPGQAGQNGTNGANGSQGPAGTNGQPGANGANGAAGPAGSSGPKGDTGAAGATGKAGRDGKVTCKVSKNGKSVSCTVRYSASTRATTARLTRAGKTVATGKLVKGKVTFAKKLAKGTYTLVAAGRSTKLTFG